MESTVVRHRSRALYARLWPRAVGLECCARFRQSGRVAQHLNACIDPEFGGLPAAEVAIQQLDAVSHACLAEASDLAIRYDVHHHPHAIQVCGRVRL